jgi:hypothetical protein
MMRSKKPAWVSALFVIGVAAFAVACGDDTPDQNNNNNIDRDGDGDIDSDDMNLACTTPCSGDNVCISGSCQPAFPQFYTITITSVHFAERDLNGNCWDDPGCGAPDPEIEIKLNDVQVEELDLDDDNFDLTLNETVEVYLVGNSTLEIELQDDDVVDDQEILECRFAPLNAENIRNADLSCMQNGNMIEARIDFRAAQQTP